MSMEYFKERVEIEKATNKPKIEYYCNTCKVAVLVAENKKDYDVNKHILNIPDKQKSTFIPPILRKMDKRFKDVGIIFTKHSILYKSHEYWLLNPGKIERSESGKVLKGHDCGVYE